MIRTNEAMLQRYRVKVGHIEVVVSGTNDAEAIANARLQLAKDLPRFYDLIHALEPTRFDVHRAA
ncbi:hypothetical protein [Bythopirellula polymerisocia]|uniref:Uncharacterized protein n=1 Tax=Bythopirellula polymerisocia TaxID=2528003 RepID=A0A5C6CEL6_9BACT|nr:hypothetical protein [Bythopirellula polymerisocia]TWU21249.1 hypothetical protein Pla144_46580 [Bythopirellula polymerisocia]